VEDYLNKDIGNQRPVVSWSQNFAFAADGESGSVVDDGPSGTNSDGVPVYVTDGQSATTSLAVASTTATTRATATATKSVPDVRLAPPAQGEAYSLKGGMWVSGALWFALGFM
jgi:hypothetical protein